MKRRIHLHLVLLWFICCHNGFYRLDCYFADFIVHFENSVVAIWPYYHILIKVFNIKIAPIYNTFYVNFHEVFHYFKFSIRYVTECKHVSA